MTEDLDRTSGPTGAKFGRRTLLKGGAALGTLAVPLAAPSSAFAQTPGPSGSAVRDADKDSVVAVAGLAVVETDSGKVAGYVSNGIFTFKGIPYGDTTEGANRFQPPRKPKPWAGVRSARQYSVSAPQSSNPGRLNDEEAFLFQWNDMLEGEDCLRINVWTPGINDGRKRPVMVWLHGGGFVAGAGHELPYYDGENLARRGDVVIVSLNHRLNVLGFLDLSEYGEKYAHSGNVGMLDIVAALEWVRDNIAGFGGDPGQVLIFGQSGGGVKVSTVMGMPAAKGLFHRAIVQSGSLPLIYRPDMSRDVARKTIAELGLDASTIDRLHTLPAEQLRRAIEAVLRRESAPMGQFVDIRASARGPRMGPVVDGSVLPALPFHPDAPEISADVPMMIGSTLNELVHGIGHPEYEDMTEAEVKAHTEVLFPGHSDRIVAAFRRRSPQAKPFDLWSHIATSPIRQSAINQAKSKAAQNGAPAYLYWFTWHTPVFDGRPRAFHCAELPFVFDNTDRCAFMTGGGPRARALADVMADAWIQFARTGNPNHPGMPHWAPFSAESVPTMIFDDEPRLLLNPDGEEQASIANL